MGRSAYSELGATTPARPSTAPAGRRALRSRTTLELPIPDLPAGECASPLAVEHDRDRPVVDELDLHPGAEDPVLHGDPELTERSAEPLVAPFGLGGFVSGGHPEQHEQTILDLPHDAAAGPHRRTGDALDHGPHVDPHYGR